MTPLDRNVFRVCSQWTRLSFLRRGVLLVATVARPGKAAAQHAAKEISGLVACEVVNCKSGRIFFRVLASAARVLTEEKLLQACQIEKVSVVVHRHESDPVGTFLAFEGVSPESSVKRIVDLAKSKDFGHSLFRSTAYWRLIQKKTILQELSFRCTAKRATSVGRHRRSGCTPSCTETLRR